MKNIYAFDYESQPSQPRDPGAMNDREIEARRIRILESDKLADAMESFLENREYAEAEPTCTFFRSEIGIISYYIGMCDKDGLYRYLKDLMGAQIEKNISRMEE